MTIINEGDTPTFCRGPSTSVIDLTWAPPTLAPSVRQWRVLEEETLSPHNYLWYEIREGLRQKSGWKQAGWNTKTLDKDEMTRSLGEKVAEAGRPLSVDQLSSILRTVCDKAMKKKRHTQRRAVYWWNEDIADFRKTALAAR